MKRSHSLLLIAAATLSLASTSHAALVSYSFFATVDFSGTLDGNPFNATSFSITGSGDTTNIQSGNLDTIFPTLINAVNPTILLNTTSGPLTLAAFPDSGTMSVFVTDFSGSFLYGFGGFDGFTNPFTISFGFNTSDLIGSDLATYSTWNGVLNDNAAILTDNGTLVMTFPSDTPATFTVGPVAAVPEPATAASSLLLSLAGLSLISRRNRKA
jgi:hypothetical protein